MRRIRIHRRHQYQPPQMQSAFPLQAFRSRHHRHRAAMRSPQQIKRSDSQLFDKPQKPLRRPPHGMIDPRRPIRKSRPHHVRRIDRSIRRQSRHRKPPGKRISQQPMQQESAPAPRVPDFSRPLREVGLGAQIPHARPIHLHPAFFHARTEPGTGAAETSRSAAITAKSSSNSRDNSFPAARFYLSEHRLCSLHLGSFGSPFFSDPVIREQ